MQPHHVVMVIDSLVEINFPLRASRRGHWRRVVSRLREMLGSGIFLGAFKA